MLKSKTHGLSLTDFHLCSQSSKPQSVSAILWLSTSLSVLPSFCVSPSVALCPSTEQQRFINVPAWFLAIPASSDLSLLEFIKNTHSPLQSNRLFASQLLFSPFKPICFNVCFSLCNLSFTLAKRKQQHKYHQPSCYHKY